METERYTPANKVRIVTAAALFDGHDASINIMRRILQSSGAEVIHLGHNRAVSEVVEAAIEEDAQAIAISSYQSTHSDAAPRPRRVALARRRQRSGAAGSHPYELTS